MHKDDDNEKDFIITSKPFKENKNNTFDCYTRNLILFRFFKKVFPKNDIRIMADENSPAVVIDHEFILSVYVSNYRLRFMNKNQKSQMLFELDFNTLLGLDLENPDDLKKLNKTEFKLTKEQIDQINNWYTQSQHRKINKIYLESESTKAPLYLIRWNFKNKTLREGKYPMFGEHEPKVFFTKEKAVEVQTELIQMGYNVIIV